MSPTIPTTGGAGQIGSGVDGWMLRVVNVVHSCMGPGDIIAARRGGQRARSSYSISIGTCITDAYTFNLLSR